MRYLLALLLPTLGTLLAAPVPKDLRKRGDKEALVGTWRPAPGDRYTAWFRFAADGTLETWNPPGDSSPMKWTWTDLDPKGTPKRMTLTRVQGGQVYTCPYELTGDTLRFAFYTGRQDPPADFATRGGDNRLLVREKQAK